MNTENIRRAISMMERVRDQHLGFSMQNFFADKNGTAVVGPLRTGEDAQFHACGNTACFAGYASIASELRDCLPHPSPGAGITGMLREKLGLSATAVSVLCYNFTPLKRSNHILYQKPWAEVTPQDVIDVLNTILLEGPEFLEKRYDEFMTLP